MAWLVAWPGLAWAQPVGRPVITIPIQAVRVLDDDGGRGARITPEQVLRWVEYANTVLSEAGVRVEVGPPGGDWFEELRSTAVNNLILKQPAETLEMARARNESGSIQARELALQRSDRMLVLFRHGPGSAATGNGYSSADLGFVVMPGFDDTTICGRPNVCLLAHEIGHVLGLQHTFRDEFDAVADAEAALAEAQGDIRRFDGDGLDDTPPDPGVRALVCGTGESVRLGGRERTIPRGNLMSYLDAPEHHISPQQQRIVRWMAEWRSSLGFAGASNTCTVPEGTVTIEAEALRWAGRNSGMEARPQGMLGFGWYAWSGSAQQFFSGTVKGAWFEASFTVERAGTYDVVLLATSAPDYGRVRCLVDGVGAGVGGASAGVDLFAPVVLPTGPISLGTRRLEAGTHTVRIEVVGKSRESTGLLFGVDALRMRAIEGIERNPGGR